MEKSQVGKEFVEICKSLKKDFTREHLNLSRSIYYFIKVSLSRVASIIQWNANKNSKREPKFADTRFFKRKRQMSSLWKNLKLSSQLSALTQWERKPATTKEFKSIYEEIKKVVLCKISIFIAFQTNFFHLTRRCWLLKALIFSFCTIVHLFVRFLSPLLSTPLQSALSIRKQLKPNDVEIVI